ncbi:class III signal peptide-containing protein [Methanocaldococcus sp.]|uniref:class III signal peptide-containing protein n=1 Tax=Methanocaldococcus sp. TaxID=2152917 RepID=UPI0026030DFE|nr:class III signal peptide-containing protein [Methanocaldococcus sp.]MCQ6253496.1 class III signal peptide-containing protein [Methanocaldococcus sp.]
MRGQISLEFLLLFLGMIIVILIATVYPGIFGLKKTVEISSMSLAYAAVSKMKQNIELVASGDVGTTRIVYIKCPPGTWSVNNNILYFNRSGDINYNITANCGIHINLNGNTTIKNLEIIRATIVKVSQNTVNVTIST